MKLDKDSDLGFTIDSNFVVSSVQNESPAQRAGLEPGHKMISYTLDPMNTTDTKITWDNTSLLEINRIQMNKLFEIQVKIREDQISVYNDKHPSRPRWRSIRGKRVFTYYL